MMDFRARRAQASAEGLMDAGVSWVSHVDGRIFHPPSARKERHSQLHTILGDIEFADDTVTCSEAVHAPAVEGLLDTTLGDWEHAETSTRRRDFWWFLMLNAFLWEGLLPLVPRCGHDNLLFVMWEVFCLLTVGRTMTPRIESAGLATW